MGRFGRLVLPQFAHQLPDAFCPLEGSVSVNSVDAIIDSQHISLFCSLGQEFHVHIDHGTILLLADGEATLKPVNNQGSGLHHGLHTLQGVYPWPMAAEREIAMELWDRYRHPNRWYLAPVRVI